MAYHEIRRIAASEWKQYRDTRLRALADSPDAFSTKLAEVENEPDAFWKAKLTDLAPQLELPVMARVGEVGVGLAWGRIADDQRALAHLHHMWVEPRHRRHGVGADLVRAVVDWAKAQGAESVCLSVAVRNTRAISLYRALGFESRGNPTRMRGSSDAFEQEMCRSASRDVG